MSTFKVELSREVITTERANFVVDATDQAGAELKASEILVDFEGGTVEKQPSWSEDEDLAQVGPAKIERVTLHAFTEEDAAAEQ